MYHMIHITRHCSRKWTIFGIYKGIEKELLLLLHTFQTLYFDLGEKHKRELKFKFQISYKVKCLYSVLCQRRRQLNLFHFHTFLLNPFYFSVRTNKTTKQIHYALNKLKFPSANPSYCPNFISTVC